MPDYARTIAAKVTIDWDFDDVYTDESDYLVSASGQMRYHPPGTGIWSGSGIVDRCVLTLDNSTGRFSPLNSSGPLYSALRDGGAYNAPMALEISIDNGASYHRRFTGVIKIPQETGGTSKQAATVTIDCRSNEEAILSKRISTTAENFAWRYNHERNESDAILGMLVDAGIDAGDMELDAGTFVIPWAWLDQESPVEGCWKAAAAAGGRFYCDPDGKFVYDRATAWLENARSKSSQASLATGSFQRCQPYYNDSELYESITVTAYPLEIIDQDSLWESDAVYSVPAGETVVVDAEFDDPAYVIDDADFDAVTSGGVDLSGSVTLTQTNYAQRVSLSFANAHATQAALVQNIVIAGRSVEAIDEVTKRVESSDSFWTHREGRDRLLTGNHWIQTQAQLTYLTGFLSARHELPRLFWRVSGVPGDPERRLGDRISVTDASLSVANRDAFVIAVDWTFAAGGPFTENLEAVDATDIYPYIDDATSYFVVGTDTLGTGSTSPGRVFY